VSKRRNGLRASVRAAAVPPPAPVVVPEPVGAGCGSDRAAGFHGDHLHDAGGRTYELVHDDIAPARAQELLRAGALMLIDDCGCRGYCGLEWPDAAERTVLARRPPKITKRGGSLEEWRSTDGHHLLIQNGDVRWP
jgi:hypothetical protein